MAEGARSPTQLVAGRLLPAVEAATELGLTVVGSAALMQSRLARGLPDELRGHFPGCVTDAQRALTFARSVPGVTSALVGMRDEAHVDENLSAATA
jgi:predicted aldo/keto reductase-like oxidoreductase